MGYYFDLISHIQLLFALLYGFLLVIYTYSMHCKMTVSGNRHIPYPLNSVVVSVALSVLHWSR